MWHAHKNARFAGRSFHWPFSVAHYISTMGHRHIMLALLALIAGGCTPGAQSVPVSTSQVATAVTISVSLLTYPDMSSAYGMVGGFSPALVVVARGTVLQFHNKDGFNHTASSIAAASFPGGSPIPLSALQASGSDIAQPAWSTGIMTAGSYSRTFTTSTVGQYLFGCYYHYPSGMRGVIIVQ